MEPPSVASRVWFATISHGRDDLADRLEGDHTESRATLVYDGEVLGAGRQQERERVGGIGVGADRAHPTIRMGRRHHIPDLHQTEPFERAIASDEFVDKVV